MRIKIKRLYISHLDHDKTVVKVGHPEWWRFNLEVEAVAEFSGDEPWIVKVESTNGYGVVEKDAVVGDVDDVDGDFPTFANCVTG